MKLEHKDDAGGETFFHLSECDELGHTITICGYRTKSGEYSLDSVTSDTGEEYAPDDFLTDEWTSQYEAILKS